MKSTILVLCLGLVAITTNAQPDNRVMPLNPLRMGDGKMFSSNDNYTFSTPDTIKRNPSNRTLKTGTGDPHALRFNSLQIQKDLNSVQLNWTAVQQQYDADYFEIQQADDAGGNWKTVGTVPASRAQLGAIPYNFTYNKSLGNTWFRVAAVTSTGDRIYSSVLESSLYNNLSITPNPVLSTAMLRIGAASTANLKILVVNSSGLVVKTIETGVTRGTNNLSLDMSGMQKGYYSVTIIWPGGKQDEVKLVKQ
ncbi:MAG: T9SS type A sorting domain-containing protein [Flavisolibacter sp.]